MLYLDDFFGVGVVGCGVGNFFCLCEEFDGLVVLIGGFVLVC